MKKAILSDLLPEPSPMRDAFKTLGVKQSQIANYLGVSNGYVSQLLNGYAPVKAQHATKLTNLLARAQREAAAEEEHDQAHELAEA